MISVWNGGEEDWDKVLYGHLRASETLSMCTASLYMSESPYCHSENAFASSSKVSPCSLLIMRSNQQYKQGHVL